MSDLSGGDSMSFYEDYYDYVKSQISEEERSTTTTL